MILYPAIDILDGEAVRLVQGRFEDRTVYNDDPLEAADHVVRRQLGGLRPARGRDVAVADVDRHDDPRPPGGEDLVQEVDVAKRGRSDDRPLGAGAQRVAHGVHRAQAAAVLDRDPGAVDDPA